MYSYIDIRRVKKYKNSYHFSCNHIIAPLGDKVFVVLGDDRLLYVNIDSEIGKELAVRVVKKQSWYIKQVKPYSRNNAIVYTIPKAFASALEIKKGEQILLLGNEHELQMILLRDKIDIIANCLGKFKEKFVLAYFTHF